MRTIAWNVDTQYDFMRPDGKLYVQGAETIEPKLYTLTAIFALSRTPVVNTADWHNEASTELSTTPDYITTFPPHCMQDTGGAEYVRATRPHNPLELYWAESDGFFDSNPRDRSIFEINVESYLSQGGRNFVLYKDHFDVFEGTKAADPLLSILKPDRVFVYGVATNVCVNYAVQGLVERGLEVYVVTDAIKELPNLSLETILESWKEQGVHLTTVDEVRSYTLAEN
jgi:nicotinamidase/pyrazinamidase